MKMFCCILFSTGNEDLFGKQAGIVDAADPASSKRNLSCIDGTVLSVHHKSLLASQQ